MTANRWFFCRGEARADGPNHTKRHPSIEDHVTLYANATILGGDTVIGKHSIIGGNVWLTHSVPAYARVYHEAKITVRQPQNIPVLNFQI